MKVTLIVPESAAIGFTDLIRAEPLGLEMVAATLRDHDVTILDLRLMNNLESWLHQKPPDACGIGCNYTIDCPTVLQLAQRIKQVYPDLFIFTGGHHATMSPLDFRDSAVDAVVMGEGETTVWEMVHALEEGQELSKIPGVFLTRSPDSEGVSPRPLRKKLDTLPFPERIRKSGKRDGYHMGFQHPLALIETSRGCAFQCSFCSVWQFYGGTYRTKSPERVIEEIDRVREPFILFVDDNFLLNIKRAERIADLLKAEGLTRHYTFQARSDTIVKYPKVVEAWKQVGLQGVFIGVEKVEDSALKGINKHNSVENNIRAIELLQKMGIDVWTSFIVDPGFNHEDFQKLRDFIIQHGLKSPTFSVLTPLPGTRLFKERYSELTTTDYTLYDIAHAVLPTRLPLREFYEEFCSLYGFPYSKVGLVWEGFQAWLHRGLSLRLLFQMIAAARRLADPESYLQAHGDLE